MPARFRLYDVGPDKGADRFFVVDSRPYSPDYPRGPWRAAVSFSREPYHPQGIGLAVELSAAEWGNASTHYFRSWGKRVKLEDLIERDGPSGAYLVVEFVMTQLDDGAAREALLKFLQEQHGARYDRELVHKIRANPRVARVLHTLLRKEAP